MRFAPLNTLRRMSEMSPLGPMRLRCLMSA